MWILIVLFAFYFLGLVNWRLGKEPPGTFGTAHWCSVWPLFQRGLFKRKGLIVGDWTGLLPVRYDMTHAITFGTTGVGKGTTAVLPNLLSYKHVFLLDPGGENTAIAARHWRKAGSPFGCINIFGLHTEEPWGLPAHGFNPLDLLDPQSPSFAADALVIAEMLIRRSAGDSGNTSFFKNTARGHLRDFIVHCKTAEPPERQNLATVFQYMHSDARDWDALLKAMKANLACGGIARVGAIAMERREAESSEENSGVNSTMKEEMNWLVDPLVREYLSRSDVDFATLRNERGGIISIILPLQYNRSHAAVSRLALACAVLTMQRAPAARNKVLFLIDEAADLGKIEQLPEWLATLRKYNVVLWPIFQNMGQLVELYGRGWQTLVANCGMLQFLGFGNDLETTEHTERLLGKCTVQTVSTNPKGERSLAQVARSLHTSDELRRLHTDWQIVLIGNLPPIGLMKTPYWKRPELGDRFNPNPYHPGKSRLGILPRLRVLWGRFYYLQVCAMGPHPVAALIWTGLFAAALLAAFGLLAPGGRG